MAQTPGCQRGAARVVAVEKAILHTALIRENLRACGLPDEALEVRTQDVAVALPALVAAGARFDLIFADPPFGPKNLGRRSQSPSQQLLDAPDLPRLLAPDGLLVLGHARRDTLTVPPTWTEAKALRHGDSVMLLLRTAPAAR